MSSTSLRQAYVKLPSYAQRIVQICAVANGTVSNNQLAEISKQFDLRDDRNKPLDYRDINRITGTLRGQRLLQSPEYGTLEAAPSIVDAVVQDTIREGEFKDLSNAILKKTRPATQYSWDVRTRIRDLRIAFYRGNVTQFKSLATSESFTEQAHLLDPFDPAIFQALDPLLRQMYLIDVAPRLVSSPSASRELIAAFDRVTEGPVEVSDELVGSWLDLAVARGDLASLRRLDELTDRKIVAIAGCEALLLGDYDRANSLLSQALPLAGRGGKKHSLAMRNLPLPLFLLLQFKQPTHDALERVRKLIDVGTKSRKSRYSDVLRLLGHGFEFAETPKTNAWFTSLLQSHCRSPLALVVAGYLSHWLLDNPDMSNMLEPLPKAAKSYRLAGLDWLSTEAAGLWRLLGRSKDSTADEPAATQSVVTGTTSLIGYIEPEPLWQRTLNAISRLVGTAAPTDDAKDASRIAERLFWEIHTSPLGFDLHPYAQKRTTKGWTNGRRISLATIQEQADDPQCKYMTDQDRAIARTLKVDVEDYYGAIAGRLVFDEIRAARALIGHPLVFRENDRENPVEIAEEPPKLVVTKHSKTIHIRLDPQPEPVLGDGKGGPESPSLITNDTETEMLRITLDGPRRLVFVFFSAQHLKLHEILRGKLEVPKAAAERVLASLQAVSSLVPVHSEIGGDLPAMESVPADPRPQAHLIPHQGGLRVELYVRPFGDEGPYCRAGQGGRNVFASLAGVPKSALRDLKTETRLVAELQAECPFLSDEDAATFPTPVEALEALVQLDRLRAAGRLVLHWPQGESFKLAGEATASQLYLQIRKDRDWFAATGTLKADNDVTIDMMKLIELIEGSSSRFVQLDDGRFLALTEQLRKRVRELAAFGEQLTSKLRFPGVRAAALDDLGDLQVKADNHWKECVERMRAASTVRPDVPSTLQAELRDYQREGFQWLASLAAWGVGGCLADDMGLGKTVQAIAMLLHRAPGGPALVVAPTSVAFNWVNELARFAPTLNPRIFGGGNRDAFFADLGPRDVAICSYGLLHNEAERFQQQAWHTAILDEAQAIKNTATRRSQAAMGLQADFRLIMTGTPLENHLGELWNLFQFINPGLLGSLESFQQRFSGPIERDHCMETRRRLKKLIQPFILRRTKTQVLSELPSRTELTLQVELSSEEAAFYEALRRTAVQKLAEPAQNGGGAQHLRILAELMRLRRACCHPRLAVADCGVSSSKLALFSETIDELLAGNHKALVFSQFVDHLTILREELDRKKIAYQYLDGSTPAKDRKSRVEAFQAGQGDVFLISLKAGGLGLNLTAADYVLHMDPWWNPAVEDQASDRAHRMGQQRPVTIYRFITKGTIEERITDLHASKRDLADSLLEGTDVSGKLSADQLLQLIRD